jgi:FixJ family two-component response regulator
MSEVPLVAVVDDDESIREATQSLLLSAGFQAAAFASAEDFLQAPQRQDTACLIVDVRMPGMSGLDLQQQLARSRSAIALIFITSHEDDEARARALRAGAVDFLYKPFSDEALLRAIRSALRGAAS